MAALLHDVVEDTAITKQDIGDKFGKAVAELVDGVSKLDKIEFQTEVHAQARISAKCCWRWRVMCAYSDQACRPPAQHAHPGGNGPEKRQRIARETLEIYAPIANRLGLNSVYDEMEDLSFRHLYPNRFDVLAKAVKAARGNRREVVGKVLEAIKQKLKDCQIEATITGREKHLYSIYKKMQGKS